jgi:hypothetical protein
MKQFNVSCGFHLPEPRTIEAETADDAVKIYLRLLGKIEMFCQAYSDSGDGVKQDIPVKVSKLL